MGTDPLETHAILLRSIPGTSLTDDDGNNVKTVVQYTTSPTVILRDSIIQQNVDLMFTVDYVRVDAKRRLQSVPYTFDIRLQVGLWLIDKPTESITGEKLRWKAIEAVRDIYDGDADDWKCVISEESDDRMVDGQKLLNYNFIVRHKTFKS